MTEWNYEKALYSTRKCIGALSNIDDNLSKLEETLIRYRSEIKDNISDKVDNSIKTLKIILKEKADLLKEKENRYEEAMKVHRINEED